MINKTNYVIAIDRFWKNSSLNYLKWAEKYGISYHEFLILYRLGRSKSITQKEISLTYGIPKQSVSYEAKSLNGKGLIELRVSKTDRREKDMVLTKEGEQLVEKCVRPLLKIEEDVFERIGTEQIVQMLETAELFSDLIGKGMENEL